MPELPEVEALAGQLRAAAVGRSIGRVDVAAPAALKTFDLVYVTTSGGPGTATTVPSYEVYNRAFNLKEVGSASAVAIVLTVLVFGINVVISRIGEERVAGR